GVVGTAQRVEREPGVFDLGLLEADHVRPLPPEPGDQSIGPRADRVDVPGDKLHVNLPPTTWPCPPRPDATGRSTALSKGMGGAGSRLDPRAPSYVRIPMKASNDLSLWSIIERLQRRLERQGMSAAAADRAVATAIRQLALAGR